MKLSGSQVHQPRPTPAALRSIDEQPFTLLLLAIMGGGGKVP